MTSLVEQAKKAAAYKAVDEHFPPNAKIVGVGSGSTIIYAVERMAQRDDVAKTIFVPTGFQSQQLIISNGLLCGSVDQYAPGDLEIAFDGADEVDANLNCIKGGGGCLFQEKLVSECAPKFVLIADDRKKAEALGTVWLKGIPIEVVDKAYTKVTKDLYNMGAKIVNLRLGAPAKAGPCVTDNGNFILDAHFGPIDPKDVAQLNVKIKMLVGVVETGIFTNADVAYFGNSDGSVEVKSRACA